MVVIISLFSSCITYYPDPVLLFKIEYNYQGQHIEDFEYYQPPKKTIPFPMIKVDLGIDEPRPVFRYDGNNWYFMSIPDKWGNDIFFSVFQDHPYTLGKSYVISVDDVLWINKGGLSNNRNHVPVTLGGSYSFKVGKDKNGEYEAFLFSFDEKFESSGETIDIRDGILYHYVKDLSNSDYFTNTYVSEE